MSDSPTRVDELEVRIAFQDELLATLSDGMAQQQLQIEALRRELAGLRADLSTLRAASAHDVRQEPPPPHY